MLAAVLLLGAGAPAPSFHEAFRLEAVEGRVPEAAAAYAGLLADPACGPEAGLGLGRCLERLGRREAAADAYGWVLSAAAPDSEAAGPALEGVRRTAPARLESREAPDGTWLLSRAEVADAVAGAFQILSRAKVEPYLERDGAVGGLLLRSLEADSLPARRGLKAYDLVRRINGRPLTAKGAEEILALVSALKGADRIEIELERVGAPKTLRYRILSEREMALSLKPYPPPEAPRP